MTISTKFRGDRTIVQVAVASLAANRPVLLCGPPGTGKTRLAELLAWAIDGRADLVVHGTRTTTEAGLTYGWQPAVLAARGPCDDALVPSPVLAAMRAGRLVRVEALGCLDATVQDALIGPLRDRTMLVAELRQVEEARAGFNLVATASDRGKVGLGRALSRLFTVVGVPEVVDRGDRVQMLLQEPVPPCAGRSAEQVARDVASVLDVVRRDLDGSRRRPAPAAARASAEAVINQLHHAGFLGRPGSSEPLDGDMLALAVVSTLSDASPDTIAALRERCAGAGPDEDSLRELGQVLRLLPGG